MATVAGHTLIEQLNWRYAVKKFDPSRAVAPADWDTLERAMLLAPSSFGLSPWKFVVVTSPAVKQALTPLSHGQPQIRDCSHLVVFAARKGLDVADVDRFIARVAEVRHAPAAALDGYRQMMVGTVQRLPPAQLDAWSARQVYIALGFLLSSAAMLGIDACPMEGIDAAQYDQTLGLAAQGYGTLCVAAVGYRAADDPAAGYAKVRFDPSDVVTHVG